MIEWQDQGIILSARAHGENGGIVSILTRDHGRAAAYMYGVTSAKSRSLIEIGNFVDVHWQAKTEGQMGSFSLELEKSYAADVMDSPVKLTALQSACALADRTMPEHERHLGVYEGLRAVLSAFATEYWAPAYVYWEVALLKELGFGLDLATCAATGTTEDLIYVSPKSGRAVCRTSGFIYKEKMLNLPPFLRGEARFEDADIRDGLKLTGHFLLNRVFSLANENLPEPRLRLAESFF